MIRGTYKICRACRGLTVRCNGVALNNLDATARDSWRQVTTAFLAQNGLAATALRCFPTEPTFGTRATTVCGGLGSASTTTDGIYLVRFLDEPGPIKLPRSPARYASSTGAIQGSWCLQVHLASAFAGGVQRNVDESRGAAVDS